MLPTKDICCWDGEGVKTITSYKRNEYKWSGRGREERKILMSGRERYRERKRGDIVVVVVEGAVIVVIVVCLCSCVL